MADAIKLKIKEYEQPKFKCATCDNNITELMFMKLPFCDDCLKDLREIIKERRLEKEKAEFKLKVKERCAELERRYFR